MKMDNFFRELNRRNVCKVAVAYAVARWLVIQMSFALVRIALWMRRRQFLSTEGNEENEALPGETVINDAG